MAYRLADDPGVRVHVLDLGLACCAMEVGAAIERGLLVPADGPADGPGPVHVLLISGTVTEPLIPAVLAAWQGLPEPRAALSFGSCANSGGPYWDSPTVLSGVDRILPVTTYTPGCPPRPEALIDGLRTLARTVSA